MHALRLRSVLVMNKHAWRPQHHGHSTSRKPLCLNIRAGLTFPPVHYLRHIRSVQLKDDPAGAEIEVTLPPSVTGWGPALLDALAEATGLPAVVDVWVRDADGNIDGPLRSSKRWAWITEPDVTVLVRGPVGGGAPAPPSRAAGGAGGAALGFELPALSEEEQNWRRVQALFLDEPCPVPRIMQQASQTP
jgi:hypothetical protein